MADIAVFIQLNGLNLVLDMLDAALGADLGQQARKFHCIQMISIAEALLEFGLTKHPRALAQTAQIVVRCDGLREIALPVAETQEVFGRVQSIEHLPVRKGVYIVDAIAVGIRIPVAELDTQFERRVGLANKSRSEIPASRIVRGIRGTVASPTPTVEILGLSIRQICGTILGWLRCGQAPYPGSLRSSSLLCRHLQW